MEKGVDADIGLYFENCATMLGFKYSSMQSMAEKCIASIIKPVAFIFLMLWGKIERFAKFKKNSKKNNFLNYVTYRYKMYAKSLEIA